MKDEFPEPAERVLVVPHLAHELPNRNMLAQDYHDGDDTTRALIWERHKWLPAHIAYVVAQEPKRPESSLDP